jgi:hypothetical protein
LIRFLYSFPFLQLFVPKISPSPHPVDPAHRHKYLCKVGEQYLQPGRSCGLGVEGSYPCVSSFRGHAPRYHRTVFGVARADFGRDRNQLLCPGSARHCDCIVKIYFRSSLDSCSEKNFPNLRSNAIAIRTGTEAATLTTSN